ncbi:TetR/AcrR family transcriptional regulator [Streptomyces pratens]|uniref:TetR/AcrR family transcriptional regulator n=1 Tax=Streptomyces pratens TaxID=887456 RepID=A0ABW1M3Z7_9ACTN
MSSTPPSRTKPLRSDAQRNRARILTAAEEVFASGGPSASTEDIARRAGVAVGTVFRHFPTKAALIEAVFVNRLGTLTREAGTAIEGRDAGAAFFSFFELLVRQSAVKHAFTDAMSDGDDSVKAVWAAVTAASDRLSDAVGRLLSRAQRSGAVRADVTASDVIGLMIGAARAAEHVGGGDASRARVLAVVKDGLRSKT